MASGAAIGNRRAGHTEVRDVVNRQAHVASSNVCGQLGLNASVGAGHRVSRVAEVQMQPIDPAIEVILAVDMAYAVPYA